MTTKNIMKKLLTLLLLFPLFIACSSDDDDNTPSQDYTSFVVTNTSEVDLPNVIIGYLVDGKYKKLANLGDLKKGMQSSEVKVNDSSITLLYAFTDYNGTVRADITFTLNKNKKNTFELPSGVTGIGITDKSDPAQYPQ